MKLPLGQLIIIKKVKEWILGLSIFELKKTLKSERKEMSRTS